MDTNQIVKQMTPRLKRTYPQPSDASVAVTPITGAEADEHLERMKRVTRAEAPTTFQQYQQWLHDWRKAWKLEVRVARDERRTYTLAKLTKGLSRRHEVNAPYQCTPAIESACLTSTANNIRIHTNKYGYPTDGYAQRCELLKLRIERKPMGKALWLAQPKPELA